MQNEFPFSCNVTRDEIKTLFYFTSPVRMQCMGTMNGIYKGVIFIHRKDNHYRFKASI